MIAHGPGGSKEKPPRNERRRLERRRRPASRPRRRPPRGPGRGLEAGGWPTLAASVEWESEGASEPRPKDLAPFRRVPARAFEDCRKPVLQDSLSHAWLSSLERY
jgi:hypothetical protein